jgi:hypothetical protein
VDPAVPASSTDAVDEGGGVWTLGGADVYAGVVVVTAATDAGLVTGGLWLGACELLLGALALVGRDLCLEGVR